MSIYKLEITAIVEVADGFAMYKLDDKLKEFLAKETKDLGNQDSVKQCSVRYNDICHRLAVYHKVEELTEVQLRTIATITAEGNEAHIVSDTDEKVIFVGTHSEAREFAIKRYGLSADASKDEDADDE